MNGFGGVFASDGAGRGRVTSSSGGSGTFGELHLYAFTDNGQFQTPSFDQWGTVSPTPRCHSRLTISIGDAFINSGDATFEYMLYDKDTARTLVIHDGHLDPGVPSYFFTQDYAALSGDELSF